MSLNGRLAASELAPIAGGQLRKDAAAAWNAMNVEARQRFGVTLLPMGSMSSYRTYDQQVYLWNHVQHAHDPNWVAVPGSSNHGWGLAVDLATPFMRHIIDTIGWKYGFTKGCSDAPVEWWHIKYNPSCTRATWHGGNPGPDHHAPKPVALKPDEESWIHNIRALRARVGSGSARQRFHRRLVIRKIKRAIRGRLKSIEAAAKRYGWKVNDRRRRYDLLKRVLRGN